MILFQVLIGAIENTSTGSAPTQNNGYAETPETYFATPSDYLETP